jgi:hypothetical protein
MMILFFSHYEGLTVATVHGRFLSVRVYTATSLVSVLKVCYNDAMTDTSSDFQTVVRAAVQPYLDFLESHPDGKEILYRTPLETLINAAQLPHRRITALQEDRRSGIAVDGTPDFFVYEDERTLFKRLVGFIECKQPSYQLERLINSEQVKRYAHTSENLILTNYRRFILLQRGEVLQDIVLTGERKAVIEFANLLFAFYQYEYPYINTKKSLASSLAAQSFYYAVALREFIADAANAAESFYIRFDGLFSEFQQSISYHYELADFCDIYSQSLVYGLLLARLDAERRFDEKDLDYLKSIPTGYKLLYEFLSQGYERRDMPLSIKTALVNIGKNINMVNVEAIRLEFLKSGAGKANIAVYLYEDFLGEYDRWRGREDRKEGGVYYTPSEVTDFITRSVEFLIRERFGMSAGYMGSKVKVLDFACGTGTFLHSILERMLYGDTDELKRQMVKEKIVRDIYGFEVLWTPYIIAHTLLTRFLADKGVGLEDKERLGVYLTNTLDISQHSVSALLPQLKQEHDKAMGIKGEESILAIVGNPPYFNGKSRAGKGVIDDELMEYKKGLNEKKLNLDDMYIKFIRFAEWKIEKSKQGIVGIITNNSYLYGVNYRQMRKHLYETFDGIYIVNLHGNSRKGEVDKNIFDIMVGVCIAFFVKQKTPLKNKDKRVFYFSMIEDRIMTRREKFDFLKRAELTAINWQEVNPCETEYFWFVPKNLSQEKIYKKFWKITDIFSLYNSGFETKKDEFVFGYNKDKIETIVEDFQAVSYDKLYMIKEKYHITDGHWTILKAYNSLKSVNFDKKYIRQIQYRPFDERWTFLHERPGFLARPRYETSRHFEKGNVGLCFTRTVEKSNFTDIFITTKPIDGHIISGHNYLTPLYTFVENNGEVMKKANFSEHFENSGYLSTLAFTPSPEEILAYIYAVLHSPVYRETYIEFLKTDFPAIPMTSNEAVFKKYAALGQRLINRHLLKDIPDDSSIRVSLDGVKNGFRVKRIVFANGKLSLGTVPSVGSPSNASIIFDGVSAEVYDFEIGSYKPVEKWLKYRAKDAVVLGIADLQHVKNMFLAIKDSIIVMKEIAALGQEYLTDS